MSETVHLKKSNCEFIIHNYIRNQLLIPAGNVLRHSPDSRPIF